MWRISLYMVLDFEDSDKIVQDKCDAIEYVLKVEGFVQKTPRADFSSFTSSLTIYREDGSKIVLPTSQMDEILEGKKSISDEDKKAFDEWYNTSLYRVGYQMDSLEKQRKQAMKDDDPSKLFCIEDQQQILSDEQSNLSDKDYQLIRLSHSYNEKGERLQRLYDICLGEYDTITLPFGSFDVKVGIKCNTEELDKLAYATSEGFFEDLKAAYKMMEQLKGPLEISESTGILYSTEFAYGYGKGVVHIDDTRVELEARINHHWKNNRPSAQITTSKIPLEGIGQKVRLFLPDYGFDEDQNLIRNDNSTLFCHYSEDHLLFQSNPDLLSTEVERVLQVVLK